MTLIERAAEFAQKAHSAQKRKYTGEPYFFHCKEVAEIVQTVPHDESMVAAAYLHDTVEDTGTSIETIQEIFGEDVALLVEQLTDVSKPGDGNRETRKHLDFLHTAEASKRAKTVKLADLISNSNSIIEHDRDFAKVYLKEKLKVLTVLLEADPVLYERACSLVREGMTKLYG